MKDSNLPLHPAGWLTAAEMAAMQGSWAASDLDSLARGARPSAGEQARLRRQAGGPASYAEELKERAESAVQQLRDLEPRIKPWAPSFSLRRLREERRAFERQLGLRAGEPGVGGGSSVAWLSASQGANTHYSALGLSPRITTSWPSTVPTTLCIWLIPPPAPPLHREQTWTML